MDALLSVHSIGRQVNQRWIWRDLSFSVQSGDRLGVVGASGAGKSLLLRAIACLDALQTGDIFFEGKSLSEWSIPAYRACVMYLHQRPVFPDGTVEQMLRQVYTFASHRQQRYERDRVVSMLEQLGRDDTFLNQSTRSLSGGESQIVAFLRALQLSPTVLLLDEPTASLDPDTAYQIERLVEAWQAEDAQRAYLWTSHSPAQLQRVTDRTVVLSSGIPTDGATVH